MIEVIEGKGVGAGKSYDVIERAMFHWLRGGTAFISDTFEVVWPECKEYAARVYRLELQDSQYRVIGSDMLTRLHEVTAAGSEDLPVQIYVDEAQGAFNARDFGETTKGSAKRAFFDWLCQSRHDDNDVIIISQAAANVDKQIRRLCTYIWSTRNSEFFQLFGISLRRCIQIATFGINDGRYFIRTQFDQDGRTKLGRKWVRANPKLFKCYRSKAMRLKHRRLAETVARLKLNRVPRRKVHPMLKFAVPIVFLLLVVGGCKGYNSFSSMWKKPSVVSARVGNSGSASVGSVVCKDGDVLHVAVRGSVSGYMDTVEWGPFALGEPSVLGLVEMVGRNVVSVRLPSGGHVKVVGDRMVLRSSNKREKEKANE